MCIYGYLKDTMRNSRIAPSPFRNCASNVSLRGTILELYRFPKCAMPFFTCFCMCERQRSASYRLAGPFVFRCLDSIISLVFLQLSKCIEYSSCFVVTRPADSCGNHSCGTSLHRPSNEISSMSFGLTVPIL